MCCQDRRLRGQTADLTPEMIERFISGEMFESTDKAVLTGGEPTLNKDLLIITALIKEAGIQNIQLQTNARKLKDKAYLEQLLSAGITCFGVSLHGHTSALHEAFTQMPGSFSECIQALTNLREYGYPVSLNCVITSENYTYLGDIAKYVHNGNLASSLQFAFIHIIGNAAKRVNNVVSLSEAGEKVKDVIAGNLGGDLKIYTEAIPFCIMGGHEKAVSELYNDDTEIVVYDITGQKSDFARVRKNHLKSKTEGCAKCLFDSICEGTWSEYQDIFGYGEFVPVKKLER
jgi:MoaA/NifB/PqqE/SkfB family radical SAM enzyme